MGTKLNKVPVNEKELNELLQEMPKDLSEETLKKLAKYRKKLLPTK